MPSNPTLQLRPCTSADIPALAILRHACFTAPSNKVRVQRRSPLRQTQIPSKTAFVRNLSSPRCVNFLGVVDTTTNEIISQPHLDLPAKRATSLPKTPMSSTRSCLQAPNETLVRDFDRMTGELAECRPPGGRSRIGCSRISRRIRNMRAAERGVC